MNEFKDKLPQEVYEEWTGTAVVLRPLSLGRELKIKT